MLAIVLLAASAAPASAEFRYVPPAEAESAAEPAAKGTGALHEDIEPRPGPGQAVSGASVSGPSVWRVHAGEMLRGVLARWGARAGTEVLFLTDRRYRLEGEAEFQGGFADAAGALFAALAHLPHAPEGALSADRATLAVTHRLPGPAETGGRP
ncbi:MAG: TcpQ domain-containing protein [Rhodospirillales bacterium]|nr:TcpQ domain-containing protein [Rhodospirillales bacterium]